MTNPNEPEHADILRAVANVRTTRDPSVTYHRLERTDGTLFTVTLAEAFEPRVSVQTRRENGHKCERGVRKDSPDWADAVKLARAIRAEMDTTR